MPGPADELVGRDEDRVLRVERAVRRVELAVRGAIGGSAGRHLDVDVRRRSPEVPERQRTVPMEEHGDRPAYPTGCR